MDSKNLLKKYYARLKREGLLKSLLWGVVAGFSALLISSAIWWFFGLSNVWLCAIFFVAATACATPIFYFIKFRPTIIKTAKRVDALGLEERLITMAQLEHETSYIAQRQREDTVSALKTINEKLLRFAVSLSLIITLAVVGVLGAGMVTVAALGQAGVVGSGNDVIIGDSEIKEYEVIYEIEGEGYIEGEIFQLIEEGKDALAVIAVPLDGWGFAGWSDEFSDPYRLDTKITENLIVFAIFQELTKGGGGTEGNPGEDPADGEPKGEIKNESQDNAATPPSPGTSGSYKETNVVIDGETYYGDTFEDAYNKMMAELAANNDMPQEMKDSIKNYFDAIATKKEG